ncbi:hypothetical protein Trichorick_01514 (plasmid) [Candidatus Trichorickettsia mobilis]|nr:hypothetical protein Trichorick_01514 [Candidatus Trichorickettsia mobilis]
MPIEDFIIMTYIFVDKYFKEISQNLILRTRGEKPALLDIRSVQVFVIARSASRFEAIQKASTINKSPTGYWIASLSSFA